MGTINQELLIAEELKDLIESGAFVEGEKLPSERQLSDQFGHSRVLIRQSLKILKEEGWICSVEKSGYYICKPRIRIALNNFQSSTALFDSLHFEHKKELIHFEKEMAPEHIANFLGLPNGADIFLLKRLWIVECQPFSIEAIYIPKEICPSLLEQDVVARSFYAVLSEEYNINVDRTNQRITIQLSTQEEARLLKIHAGTPVIKRSELLYSDTNTIIGYAESLIIMERVEFVK